LEFTNNNLKNDVKLTISIKPKNKFLFK
jgi:hypothetical protein